MIKIQPPPLENLLHYGHSAYLIGMRNASDSPTCLQSCIDLDAARKLAKQHNAQIADDYPRFIGVSQSACYFDPDSPVPVRLSPRFPAVVWAGPFPLAVI